MIRTTLATALMAASMALLMPASVTPALAIAMPALAQQGWSAIQPIARKGSRASTSAVFYDGDDVWIVGAEGLIERSYDDGKSFQEVDAGVTTGLNDVFARKDGVWIVGDGGLILTSTDGGHRFNPLLYNTDPNRNRLPSKSPSSRSVNNQPPPAQGAIDLYSIQFADETHGYIVGDRGLILATSDAGASWREQRSGTDAQLFHLAFKGERGWAVGTGGTIVHTENGGESWVPQPSNVPNDLNRVFVVTDKVLLATGDKGVLLRSESWGASWSRIPVPTQDPLFGVSFIDKKTGWVVGYGGRILRTYDGGKSWIEQASGTQIDLFAVAFHKNRGYALGRDGLVLRYFERR
ncbi:MAG TPA: YCF48-related protein [Blastocatellia bacterium]|nr:YCF48-related protein [Blastocatellia bacterium]